MLTILCEKEPKPDSILKEQHWKISVGDLDTEVFAECYIEFNATAYDTSIAINNCLTAVQERLLELAEADVITQQQETETNDIPNESTNSTPSN